MNTDNAGAEMTEVSSVMVEQMHEYETEDEAQRRKMHRDRIERMRREKERVLLMRRIMVLAVPVLVVLLVACVAVVSFSGQGIHAHDSSESDASEAAGLASNGSDPLGSNSVNVKQEGLMAAGYGTGSLSVENDIFGPIESAVEGIGLSDEDNGIKGGGEGVLGEAAGDYADGETGQDKEVGEGESKAANDEADKVGKITPSVQYTARTTTQTAAPPTEVNSTNVVFIDLASGDILAQRDYLMRINPASMTKVLTALVAAEYVTDLDDTFTITRDITDYSYSHGCSSVGFDVGETVTVRDLFYGTMLKSGGDAAVALATYVAGSHEAFVELMNERAAALGLADTAHFTNCVGIYDEEHYCTVYDMAMIMEAALDNSLCREVMNARIYTTSHTDEHAEGIEISNWFLRKIEDKDTGGEMVCAKTGYVQQSGNCAVSYGVDKSGRGYVCATTGAHSSWRCIYDHVALYKEYALE